MRRKIHRLDVFSATLPSQSADCRTVDFAVKGMVGGIGNQERERTKITGNHMPIEPPKSLLDLQSARPTLHKGGKIRMSGRRSGAST